jgi:hypothetical protein
MSTYGCTPGTVVAQKAPSIFPGRSAASIQSRSKKSETIAPGLRREAVEGVEDELARLVPGDRAARFL